MPPFEPLSLLAVGLPWLPAESREIDLRVAGSAKETIAMMRLINFDLLLAGQVIPDMTVWSMIRRIRGVHSDQKWALVSEDLTPADEIQARTLGVLAIVDTTPDCRWLCRLNKTFIAISSSPDSLPSEEESNRTFMAISLPSALPGGRETAQK